MLRVSLLGNLGADPEVRYTSKGTQVVSFRVAVNQVRTGPDGERQENTEWFRVRASSRQAEFAQRLGKGSRVLVIGRLDIGHYTGKDGEVRTSFDVWADDMQNVSGRTGGDVFGAPMAESDGEMSDAASGPAAAAAAVPVPARTPVGAGANGKAGRAHGPSPATASGAAEGDDLEDLPF
jgi:single-strand DNA-binding protein